MALDVQRASQEGVDLREKGRSASGEELALDRRLFMQFLAYGSCTDTGAVIEALEEAGLEGVVYADINDPYGIGLLFFAEQPEAFLGEVRSLLQEPIFRLMTPKPEFTMLGRTYAIGYEQDLERVLIKRPIERVTNPKTPWGIWYPLRRKGSFEQLSAQEQRVVLMEHGGIGRAFGEAGYGSDIRLACHGMDKYDNDFVVGLIGPELYPLSAIVERMRKTKQTSLHLERLGPFFIGKAIWQHARSR